MLKPNATSYGHNVLQAPSCTLGAGLNRTWAHETVLLVHADVARGLGWWYFCIKSIFSQFFDLQCARSKNALNWAFPSLGRQYLLPNAYVQGILAHK